MIKLAEVFQSGMVLQRGKPFLVWGISDSDGKVCAFLDGAKIAEKSVSKGAFFIELPAQKERENARLQIGDIVLENVDFGEVWIAGGQSNMQFYVKWDAERGQIYEREPDDHFRYFEVKKYTFEGEEKDGFKDASHWGRWFAFDRVSCLYFSSVATWFALMLREKLGVPVGIVSCNLGATSASTWMDENLLRADQDLKVYVDEFESSVQGLDMARYEEANRLDRKSVV